MKELRITVEIDRNGKITADADGYTEGACISELEKLLEGMPAWEEVTRKADPPGGDKTQLNKIGLQNTTRPANKLWGRQ
jgi:hypothetical protein